MNPPFRFRSLALVVLGTGLLFPSLRAVPEIITWSTAQAITGASDVSLTGTLVEAYNLGASGVQSTTVNGVSFAAFVFPGGGTTATVGNFSFTESPGTLGSSNGAGWGAAPFSALDASYQTLLSSFGQAGQAGTLTLTMSGLTIGQAYQFQWWTSLANVNVNQITQAKNPADALNIQLGSNPAGALGGVGQFATGTFTATGATLDIAFTGITNNPYINAVQLRAIPEPATSAAVFSGCALVAVLWVRRRRPRRPARHG